MTTKNKVITLLVHFTSESLNSAGGDTWYSHLVDMRTTLSNLSKYRSFDDVEEDIYLKDLCGKSEYLVSKKDHAQKRNDNNNTVDELWCRPSSFREKYEEWAETNESPFVLCIFAHGSSTGFAERNIDGSEGKNTISYPCVARIISSKMKNLRHVSFFSCNTGRSRISLFAPLSSMLPNVSIVGAGIPVNKTQLKDSPIARLAVYHHVVEQLGIASRIDNLRTTLKEASAASQQQELLDHIYFYNCNSTKEEASCEIFGNILLQSNLDPIFEQSLLDFMRFYLLTACKGQNASERGERLSLLVKEGSSQAEGELKNLLVDYKIAELKQFWGKVRKYPTSDEVEKVKEADRTIRDWGHSLVRLESPDNKKFVIAISKLIQALLSPDTSPEDRLFCWQTIMLSYDMVPRKARTDRSIQSAKYHAVFPFYCCKETPDLIIFAIDLFKASIYHQEYTIPLDPTLWENPASFLQVFEKQFTYDSQIAKHYDLKKYQTNPGDKSCMYQDCNHDDKNEEKTLNLIQSVQW